MLFLTVERANKAEIYISTAQEQKSLGTIGVSHDGYHVAYKLLVRHVCPILALHQLRSFSFSFYIVTVIVILL